MQITLEQARAFDAVSRHGTWLGAARELGKVHTAVMHAVRGLEERTGLTLVERGARRLRITRHGLFLADHCRRLLDAERALEEACIELRTGFESELRVVVDGVVSTEPLLEAVAALVREGATTRMVVSAGFLSGVEESFERESADMMITVLPATRDDVVRRKLPPIRAYLVAHRDSPLVKKRAVTPDDLAQHVLVMVRGSDPRLALPTRELAARYVVSLNDFDAKRRAIAANVGFGWLPEHLAKDDLASGLLARVPFVLGDEHRFSPIAYRRSGAPLGPAGRRVWSAITTR